MITKFIVPETLFPRCELFSNCRRRRARRRTKRRRPRSRASSRRRRPPVPPRCALLQTPRCMPAVVQCIIIGCFPAQQSRPLLHLLHAAGSVLLTLIDSMLLVACNLLQRHLNACDVYSLLRPAEEGGRGGRQGVREDRASQGRRAGHRSAGEGA